MTVRTFRRRSAGPASIGFVVALLIVIVTACAPKRSSKVATAPLPPNPPAPTQGAATSATSPPSPTSTSAPPPSTTAAPSPASSAQAPLPISVVTLPLVDTTRATVSHGRQISTTRALTTVVRYPDVPGRWPLIVFAHGYRVGPDTYADLCAAWAAAGYVVAAPEFPLTDAAVAGSSLDEDDLANQPADVRFVMAALSSPASEMSTHIDPRRVAVAGHSDGAETALAAAADTTLGLRAVIAMSGAPLDPGPGTNPPILVIQGDQDTTNAPDEAEAVYQAAMRPRYLLHLLGAGHLPPFAGPTRWETAIRNTTVDFLDSYLANRSAPVTLTKDGQPGIATLESSP